MSIPPRFMNELRDRLVLSEIVGRKVKLARAGREYKGCCPFHHEKTPSFYVNDDKQFYHCFGCGAHGDVIGFTMEHDNLSFIEALEVLAAEAGMQVPQQSPQDVARAREEKNLYTLIDEAAKFFTEQLTPEIWSYLTDRGVSDRLAELFRLGYAPPDGRALIGHLTARGYTVPQMVEAGLVRKSQKNGEPYSFFRDRVMFPVTDRRGRVVAFGGRVLPEHIRPVPTAGNKPPKYINSSDTPLFHKGRMLYSEAHARQAAGDDQPVIVVEGYLDVMACFEAGFRGAVAPLGTALTEEQILSLWKMIPGEQKLPILCFDGDDAGRRAAARAADRLLPLLKPYHSALFAFLPQGQDPDSLIKSQGKKAFQAVLDSALPLVDFIWSNQTAGRRFETPESRAGLAAWLEAEAARIPDRTVQQYYRQIFRDRLYQTFGGGFKKKQQQGRGRAADPVIAMRRPAHDHTRLSGMILLAALINHPYIFDSVEESFARIHISESRLDQLRQATCAALAEDSTLDSAGLQSHLKERGFATELAHILNDGIYTHAGFARPEAEANTLLAGWQDTIRFMNKRNVWSELRQAGQALALDFSEENEQKVLGLHNMDKGE